MPLVLSGVVKVQMTGFGYRAEANVEDEVEVVMVPRPLFDRLMDQSDGFRKGIMESYGRRLDDLMLLVEEVAFRRMDERLNEWLQARAERSPLLITHQDLAIELGTAREVVSRLLKELERKNQVRLARGRIDIL
ncbi:MAG: CRP/FNR family transcriptional regulator [Marinobacter psychrophilus]